MAVAGAALAACLGRKAGAGAAKAARGAGGVGGEVDPGPEKHSSLRICKWTHAHIYIYT